MHLYHILRPGAPPSASEMNLSPSVRAGHQYHPLRPPSTLSALRPAADHPPSAHLGTARIHPPHSALAAKQKPKEDTALRSSWYIYQ